MKYTDSAPVGSRVGSASKTFALLGLLAITAAPGTVQAGKKPAPPPVDYPYSIRQLEFPDGAVRISAGGLNDAGVVVGDADFPNYEWQACVWFPNGTVLQLPLLPGAELRRSGASSITGSGDLICGSSVIHYVTDPALRDADRATYWENISGGFQAHDWNDFFPVGYGMVFNRSRITAEGQYVALRGYLVQAETVPAVVIAEIEYDAVNGRVAGLHILDGPLVGADLSDISFDEVGNVLRVVGFTSESAGNFYYLWRIDLSSGDPQPLMITADQATSQSWAGAVNRLGQVQYAGVFWTDELLLWTYGIDGVIDLGDYGFGGSSTVGVDLNDAGQIVGSSTTSGRHSERRAFLYKDGVMLDLNTLAPVGKQTLATATKINNAGQIIALTETTAGSASVSFLLTPNSQE